MSITSANLRPGAQRDTVPAGHQLLLAAVLFALLPIAGFGSVWSADEGALLHQVSALDAGDGWTLPHPFPEADPAGELYPIHLASWAPDHGPVAGQGGDGAPGCAAWADGCRYLVFAKHVWFVWVATGLYGLGGYPALLILSVLGALAAAVGTARLTGLIEPAAAIPALWITGLGSPLLLNAYVAWAHTIGAALIAWGVYGLLAGGANRAAWRIFGLVLLAAACMVRTEAALAVIAVGLGWLGPAVLRRLHRRAEALAGRGRLGLAVLGAGAVGVLVDRATAEATGGPIQPLPFERAFGLIGGRIDAFVLTWLQPAYDTDPRNLLVLAAAGLVLAAAVLARRGREATTPVTVLLAIATLCVLARFLFAPYANVPGLIMAFPVLFAGLVLLRRAQLRDPTVQAVLVPFVLFCGAVLATQYRYGGGAEWGGRYFAVGLPLGISAATVGLVTAAARLERRQQVRVAALTVAPMLLLVTMGIIGLANSRQASHDLGSAIGSAAAANRGSASDRPVVVTTSEPIGRWTWDRLPDVRMLRASSDDLPTLGQRLDELGIERFTLVSSSPDTELGLLAEHYRPVAADEGESPTVDNWQIINVSSDADRG